LVVAAFILNCRTQWDVLSRVDSFTVNTQNSPHFIVTWFPAVRVQLNKRTATLQTKDLFLVPLTFQQRMTLRTGDMRIKYGRMNWTCSSFQLPICRRLLPLSLATAAKQKQKVVKPKLMNDGRITCQKHSWCSWYCYHFVTCSTIDTE